MTHHRPPNQFQFRAVTRATPATAQRTWLCGLLLLAAAALVLAILARPVAADQAPLSFADLAERLSPAVVNVATTGRVQTTAPAAPGAPNRPGGPESPFEDFFRDFFDRQQRPQGPAQRRPE